MHQPEDGSTRIYSHTSLDLWRLCHRRWYERYLAADRSRETGSVVALFSAELIHAPLAAYFSGLPIDWQAHHTRFVELLGHDDGAHTVGVGERILEAVRRTPPPGDNWVAESEVLYDFGISRYSTRPDLCGRSQGRRATVDFKYTEAKWRGKAPWPIRPLKSYDDQLLGQAILSEAEVFIRCTIRRDPTTGNLADLVYEERQVDAALREEWLSETFRTISDIEDRILKGGPWEKNDDACDAYGRECTFKDRCKGGFNRCR